MHVVAGVGVRLSAVILESDVVGTGNSRLRLHIVGGHFESVFVRHAKNK